MDVERSTFWDEQKQKVLDDVAEFGWHCENVLPHWSTGAYAYTVGLRRTYGHPELAILGLKPTVADYALIRAVESIKGGDRIDLTTSCESLLVGCSCGFVRVAEADVEKLFPLCRWYDQGQTPIYQIVWPALVKQFPWHAAIAGT